MSRPRACEVVRQVSGEEVGNSLVQCQLIHFHCQAVVGAGRDDPRGDLGLTAHRIDDHQGTRELEQLQQLGNGRDLVALLVETTWPRVIRSAVAVVLTMWRAALPLAVSKPRHGVLPSFAMIWPPLILCRTAIQCSRKVSNSPGFRAPKMTLKRPCEGMPLVKSRMRENQSRRALTMSAMATKSAAPQTPAQTRMTTTLIRGR
jgi:hypothetical protein